MTTFMVVWLFGGMERVLSLHGSYPEAFRSLQHSRSDFGILVIRED